MTTSSWTEIGKNEITAAEDAAYADARDDWQGHETRRSVLDGKTQYHTAFRNQGSSGSCMIR